MPACWQGWGSAGLDSESLFPCAPTRSSSTPSPRVGVAQGPIHERTGRQNLLLILTWPDPTGTFLGRGTARFRIGGGSSGTVRSGYRSPTHTDPPTRTHTHTHTIKGSCPLNGGFKSAPFLHNYLTSDLLCGCVVSRCFFSLSHLSHLGRSVSSRGAPLPEGLAQAGRFLCLASPTRQPSSQKEGKVPSESPKLGRAVGEAEGQDHGAM